VNANQGSDPPFARSGLVALGDSITRGRGMAPAFGVDPRPWAWWLAEAMELPFLNLAADGALAAEVVREQLPRVRSRFDLATLYVGVNDARSTDFDRVAFERDVRAALEGLRDRADRIAVLTIPHDLGRPRAGEDVVVANEILRRGAAAVGAAVVDLSDFGGWLYVLPDAVHPTALGQVAIADRAARALGVARRPSSVAEVERTLRGVARWTPFYARQLAKDHWRRIVERRRYAQS
jgi:lysophospholipase L1-like esterase